MTSGIWNVRELDTAGKWHSEEPFSCSDARNGRTSRRPSSATGVSIFRGQNTHVCRQNLYFSAEIAHFLVCLTRTR